MRKIKYTSILLIILLLLGLSLYYWRLQRVKIDNWGNNVPVFENAAFFDKEIKTSFLDTVTNTPRERYDKLFKYFLRGYLNYKSKNGALVYYPGEFSGRGQAINGLEGFARFFPLGCSYIINTQNAPTKIDNKLIDISDLFQTALLNGSDPSSKDYWGAIGNRDQKMAEAADIALGLWISRDFIWDTFTKKEQRQIYDWLMQIRGKTHGDNNWNLFPVMIVKSLEALNMFEQNDVKLANNKFERYLKKDFLGEGWFKDGDAPPDYYNAWAIHYCLFWINQIDPKLQPDFIIKANEDFVKFFKHFFGPKGFPMMGRSVCYRMAAPSPIIAASLINRKTISQGVALRALESTWSGFISNDALFAGKVTQGFYTNDLSILDPYSGAGSCLWSLRSLITAFYVDSKTDLFNVAQEKLPIEKGGYQIINNKINWIISGDKRTGKITLEILSNLKGPTIELDQYSGFDALLETLWQYPHRPNNKEALYKNRFYTNDNVIFKIEN